MNAVSGLEYNATSLSALYCQRRNLLSECFHGMARDILRFYREAPRLFVSGGPTPRWMNILRAIRYSRAFCDDHLLSIAAAGPRHRFTMDALYIHDHLVQQIRAMNYPIPELRKVPQHGPPSATGGR